MLTTSAAAMLASPALAHDENSASSVNVDASGLALKGHDPVAYFSAAAPTLGKEQFTAKHQGASYRFAPAANRDMFVANPAKYAPAYGGFCAMGPDRPCNRCCSRAQRVGAGAARTVVLGLNATQANQKAITPGSGLPAES